MRKLSVATVALAYVAAFSALLCAFVVSRVGGGEAIGVALICSAPALLCALVLGLHRGEPSQFLAKTVACVGMTPILLLMWGASEAASAAPTPAADTSTQAATPAERPTLDAERLFAGAVAVQQVPLGKGALLELRSAAFADGSELRLMRLASARDAAAQLQFLAQSQQGRTMPLGARAGVRLSVIGSVGSAESPIVHLEQHGTDLIQISAADEQTALARLSAQAVPVPDALAPAPTAGAADLPTVAARPPVWPFALAFAVGHALCFVALIAWAAVATTRLPPAPGSQMADDDLVRSRVGSLPASGVRCTVADGERPDELVVDYVYPEGEPRAHRLMLELDREQRCVFVRELGGASGAAPRDAAEADMRPPGSVGIDPTRPRAQKVYARTRYASFIDPAQLAALPLAVDGARVTLPADFAAGVDERALAGVVAALVTRSGWTFQPILFELQRRSRSARGPGSPGQS